MNLHSTRSSVRVRQALHQWLVSSPDRADDIGSTQALGAGDVGSERFLSSNVGGNDIAGIFGSVMIVCGV